MRVSLSDTPSFSKTYVSDFPRLSGGLNLRDLGYMVESDESPYMKNLMWRNGLLQSRPGQQTVAQMYDESIFAGAAGYAATDFQFHGYTFFHVGTGFQCMKFPVEEGDTPQVIPYYGCLPGMQYDEDEGLVMAGRGTFFRYQNHLFYKNEGGFYEIVYDESYAGERTFSPAKYMFVPQTGQGVLSQFAIYVYNAPSGVPTDNPGSGWRKLSGHDRATWKSLQDADSPIILYHPSSGSAMYAEMVGTSQFRIHAVPVSFTEDGVLVAPVAPTKWRIRLEPNASSSDASVLFCRYADDRDPPGANVNLRAGLLCYFDTPRGPALGIVSSPDLLTIHQRCAWVCQPWAEDDPVLFRLTHVGLQERKTHAVLAFYSTGQSVSYNAGPFYYRNLAEIAEQEDAPVIVINASPVNGSGAMYQPENRMCSRKTVWYNAVAGVTEYHLPVAPVQAVTNVVVDGEQKAAGVDYSVNNTTGVVTFHNAPDPGDPASNNTVQITYSKPNPDALNAVLGCKYATVASGGDAMQYIVLGGNATQPDAVFWNANDELAVSPYYFPMACYNLIGTRGDTVTGFGHQYNDTLVFTTDSVGKLTYGVESIDGRNTPSFGYARVNDKIGCDLPWTIQTVENNVVFCNSYQGAHVVLSSSAAYENNIQCLSQKINDDGSAAGVDIAGLLRDIRESETEVLSFDDDSRYWLCAGGKIYVWDYSVSTYAKPSWFYWTNIPTVALFRDANHDVYSLRDGGAVVAFQQICSDDGDPIDKVYQFPTLHFGGYDRLKDVPQVIVAIRSDVDATVSVRYDTEYETRLDKTPIVVRARENQTGLARRRVVVAKRKTGCRHVHQFGLTLRNNGVGEDLAVVSAQVFYRYQGKER